MATGKTSDPDAPELHEFFAMDPIAADRAFLRHALPGVAPCSEEPGNR